jgi:hypothetical protein
MPTVRGILGMSLSLRIAQIDLKWRLCFVAVVTAAYAVASRIIAHTSETFADVELYRTPFRILGAVLLWLAMRDILARGPKTPESMKASGFFAVVFLVFATPFLDGPYNVPMRDGVILAMTSIPVGVFEEILHRGIIQTLCIMRWGVALYSVPLFHYMQDIAWGLVALMAAAIYAACWVSGSRKTLGQT